MLSLESRELRKQAQALKAQRTITMADKIGQQQLSDNWLA
jgi:hypothetical protein